MSDITLDSVVCPCCFTVATVIEDGDEGQTWQEAYCSECAYEMGGADGRVLTIRQMLDGEDTGSTWNNVDLPKWSRLIARLVKPQLQEAFDAGRKHPRG